MGPRLNWDLKGGKNNVSQRTLENFMIKLMKMIFVPI